MGRGKIEIKKIENRTNRQVTFCKRRNGLMKKTRELSVLCDAQIGLIIFSPTGKLTQYCTDNLRMEQIIEKYHRATGTGVMHHDHHREDLFHDMAMLRQEILSLELGIQRYLGEGMGSLRYEDLNKIEDELEISIAKVRNRQNELLLQQMENLGRKERILEDENCHLSKWIQEHQEMLEFEKATAEMEASKGLHHHHHQQQAAAVIDHFPFIDEQSTAASGNSCSFLQLAAIPHHHVLPPLQYPYLQLAQPNSLRGASEPYKNGSYMTLTPESMTPMTLLTLTPESGKTNTTDLVRRNKQSDYIDGVPLYE